MQLVVKQEATLVPRGPKGQERHYACACPYCEQEVGYQTVPGTGPGRLIYMNEPQVRIPWPPK